MKTILFVILLFCGWVVPAVSQDDAWDADSDEPPSTSNARPLPKPAKINPFHFLFYEVCQPNSEGKVGYTGKYSFDIITKYGSVGFEYGVVDTLATVKIRTQYRGVQDATIWFPKEPFTLQVILGVDTARFHIDLNARTCEYVDQSDLLIFDSTREISPDLLYLQFMNLQGSGPKNFLKHAKEKFGAALKTVILEPGFYPCLPDSWVHKKNIGRHKVVNETSLGVLICVRVTDPAQRESAAAWILERQKEEFKKAGSQFGWKED